MPRPAQMIGINRKHPLNRGMKGWWLCTPRLSGGAKWYDLGGKYPGTLNAFGAGLGWKGSAQRYGSILLDGTASYVSPPATAGVVGTKSFTWAFWVATTSTVSNSTFIGEGNSGTTAQLFQARLAPPNVGLSIRDDAASSNPACNSTRTVNDGLWHHVVGTGDGTTMRLYVDGVADGSIAIGTLGSITLNQLSLGSLNRTTNALFAACQLDDVRNWPRPLSASEVAWLYRESMAGYPNALAWRTPPGPKLFFVRNAYTTPISAGSYAESGVAAGLLKGSKAIVSAGAYAESGIAAGLYAGHRAVITAGAFTEAGVAAGLLRSSRTVVAAGSFAEAGQSAGLYRGRTVVASAGAFSESGVAVGLLRSRRTIVSAGSYLMAGNAAGLASSGSTGTAATRERDIRHDVRDLLDATGTFDGVYLGGLPETAGQVADDARCCAIDPVKEDHTIDDSLSGCVVVHGSLKLTFLARAYDDQLADEACERMFLVAANALNGRSLAGLTFPVFTQITKGHWLPRKPPERRKEAVLEYRYLVDTWNTFGIAD